MYYYYCTGYLPTYEIDYPSWLPTRAAMCYIGKAAGGLYRSTSSNPTGDVSVLQGDVRAAASYLVENDPITTPDLSVSKTANSSFVLPEDPDHLHGGDPELRRRAGQRRGRDRRAAQRRDVLVGHHQPRRSLHAAGRQLARLRSG